MTGFARAIAAACLVLAGASAQAVEPPGDAARQRLLDQGEAQLAVGNAAAAEQAFDAAASMQHAPDAELGLVRAAMQAGEYRRAIGFAAHAAGAHRDEPAAAALYAWLLFLGGQDGVAAGLLGQALAALPEDPSLLRVAALIAAVTTGAAGSHAKPPPWLAPHATPPGSVGAAQVVGSGVLAGNGRLALVPLGLIESARGLWLRNGLGRTVEARAERRDEASGVAVLRLLQPLPWPAGLQAAAREPFAGSPGAVLGYRAGASAAAAWPLLRAGFFARLPAASIARPLGIETPPGPHGGPVFDQAGRLAGMAGGTPDGSATLVPAATVAALGEVPVAAAPTSGAPERAAIDTVYELGLRVALQVLVVK